MPLLVGQFVLLAAGVAIAGVVLARAADAIAEATRLGRLLVGSLLLAGATSLPELSVNLAAVRAGLPDLAVGNLCGACLMNLLVLAVLDLFHRAPHGMLARESAAHALSATLGIALAAIAATGILTAEHLPRAALLGLGPTSWALLATYVLGARLIFLDQRIAARTLADAQGPPVVGSPRRALLRSGAVFAAAAAVLVVLGPRLALVAGEIAEASGLGESFVGTVLLAICTTLPEIVTSVTALRLGAFDLAIGNVFGSNALNLALLVPLDAVHAGPLLADVSTLHAVTALGIVIATAITVLGQLYHVEKRIRLVEPDALLVVIVVLVFQYLVFRMSAG
jgi:cation:H+ antiporter